jgi:AraC family transcriptional regulator
VRGGGFAPRHLKRYMLNLKTGKFLGVNNRSHDADGVIVSETQYHRKVFEGWHSHDNYHFTFVVKGGNREQRKTEEFEATPGAIIFYRRGELHRNRNTLHLSKNINLEIKDAFLAKYQSSIPAFDSREWRRADAKFLLLKIYKECRLSDAQSIASIHALALALLCSPLEEKISAKISPWANRLREIIYDRWNETVSLSELSTALSLHPVTISRNFPKYFACTLGKYARKVKIEKAIGLIGQSRDSLADIAYQCGFADQSHFIRAFKNATGFLPGEFKKI